MPLMWWFVIVGLALLLAYELYAVVTRQTTLSAMVWWLSKRYPVVPFAFGLLMGHFFL